MENYIAKLEEEKVIFVIVKVKIVVMVMMMVTMIVLNRVV